MPCFLRNYRGERSEIMKANGLLMSARALQWRMADCWLPIVTQRVTARFVVCGEYEPQATAH